MSAASPETRPSTDAPVHLGQRAPRPKSVEDTGLSRHFLGDLVCKHLRVAGALDMASLSSRLALPGSVLESILSFLRADGRVEIHGAAASGGNLRFVLTDRGRASALEARARSGYVGAAPVPLALYERVALSQGVHASGVTRAQVREAFSGIVVRDAVLDQLGPALHSGRAIFVYGNPGTGKTFVCRRLSKLLRGSVLIPQAIAVSETVTQVYDPVLHRALDGAKAGRTLLFDEGHDERFVLCERPVITAGGELTMDLLDVQYDAAVGLYQAPLQLRANNGIFLLDDLGRQRATPTELLNRWIVPLEEHRDHLSIGGWQHFSVPFDMILVFSTNLNPLDLADEAFLRRIGYKIRFDPLEAGPYRELWGQVCEEFGLECPSTTLAYLIDELHRGHGVALLPCHPRDLAGLAMDHFRYEGKPPVLDQASIDWAWNNYFVNL